MKNFCQAMSSLIYKREDIYKRDAFFKYLYLITIFQVSRSLLCFMIFFILINVLILFFSHLQNVFKIFKLNELAIILINLCVLFVFILLAIFCVKIL